MLRIPLRCSMHYTCYRLCHYKWNEIQLIFVNMVIVHELMLDRTSVIKWAKITCHSVKFSCQWIYSQSQVILKIRWKTVHNSTHLNEQKIYLPQVMSIQTSTNHHKLTPHNNHTILQFIMTVHIDKYIILIYKFFFLLLSLITIMTLCLAKTSKKCFHKKKVIK